LIHFDIDQRHLDEAAVGNAMSRREGVLISVGAHGAVLLAVFLLPQLAFVRDLLPVRDLVMAEPERAEPAPEDETRFVFVQPRVEAPPPEPPPIAEMSDRDRLAADPEIAALPDNPLPFSRGNTDERILPPDDLPAGEDALAADDAALADADNAMARLETVGETGLEFAPLPDAAPAPDGGLLADALRNLERYVQGQTFNNPRGGADQAGSEIQFDTYGVDFGPWLRQFVAEVYSNWFIPQAARITRDRVVLQFNIYRNGRIADITVAQPAVIDALTRAAVNAISASSPVDPLPPEYPVDPALFTVTFYYGAPDR
jgi:TonB family protein